MLIPYADLTKAILIWQFPGITLAKLVKTPGIPWIYHDIYIYIYHGYPGYALVICYMAIEAMAQSK